MNFSWRYPKLAQIEGRAELRFADVKESAAAELCKRLGIGLNSEEIRRVRDHYKRIGREPTEIELQAIGQTWSEHCFHKIFKSKIMFGKKQIDGLFKSFIKKATDEISSDWLVSVFEDNAGIIKFEREHCIAAKVETHNHPSAVDPFGGAATGVGGVIRDILGVWADPIANTDVLCFATPTFKNELLPKGAKSTDYLMKGVVAGIASYGNNMGIPTVNGAVYFDDSFAGYTLVFCGCIGLVNEKNYVAKAKPGDVLVLAGSRTGREGIHGVNFASEILGTETDELRSAVQIPNPIEEEKLKRSISEISKLQLASAITDLGGGGLSSAVCEIANRHRCGAEVQLANVHLSSSDVSPWESWISETQERMLVVVPPDNLVQVVSLFEHEEIESRAIGALTRTNRIVLKKNEEKIADLSLEFLFSPPLPTLIARQIKSHRTIHGESDPRLTSLQLKSDFSDDVLKLLGSFNISSKESIVRRYDHEIQGNTIVRPLQFPNYGPNDAAVITPLPDSNRGLAISCGLNPAMGIKDPYWMSASAIDEAIRNNVAVGGRRIALLDNFAWGNPRDNEQLCSLIQAAQACHNAAVGFETPFISGKDSFYNETSLGPIAPTLLITAIGVVPDVRNCLSADFKREGSAVYLIGTTYPEMGGSEYFRQNEFFDLGTVPKVNFQVASKTYRSMNRVFDRDVALSCHDISQGGLACALAEMSFSRGLGCDVEIPKDSNQNYENLFSESNSRFVLEVKKGREKEFEKLSRGVPFQRLGTVDGSRFLITNGEKTLVDLPVSECYDAWVKTFRD
jgi:phosphoribosylformylglycinamidine synthase II